MSEEIETDAQQMEFDKVIVQTSSKALMRHIDALPSSDVYLVEVDDLQFMPSFNLRIKDASLDEHIQRLAESMAGPDGFMQDKPLSVIAVEDGSSRVLYVYDGHCRLEAVKRANKHLGSQIKRLPVVVAPNGTTLEDMTAAVFVTSTGRGLLPYEMAIGCKRFSRFGWTSHQIAKRIGITVTYVEQLLTLADAPADVRQMVIDGHVAAAVAVNALRKHGAYAGQFLAIGLAAAKRSGKAKLTPRFMPQAQVSRQIKKQAPAMFEVLCKATKDPAFSQLSADVRQMLEGVLQAVMAADAEAAQAGVPTVPVALASPGASESDVRTEMQDEAVAA